MLRSILAVAIGIATLALSVVALPRDGFAVVRRDCGWLDTVPADDRRRDPTYNLRTKCQAPGLVSCRGGGSCPKGSSCVYDERGLNTGCKGVVLGPLCRNGKHCPAGYDCVPAPGTGCYNPRISYTCGVAICASGARYVAGDRCYRCYVQHGGR